MLYIYVLLYLGRRTSNLMNFGHYDLTSTEFSEFIFAAKVLEFCGSRISVHIYGLLFLSILNICFLLCLCLSMDS